MGSPRSVPFICDSRGFAPATRVDSSATRVGLAWVVWVGVDHVIRRGVDDQERERVGYDTRAGSRGGVHSGTRP